jgi:hypothetical protein
MRAPLTAMAGLAALVALSSGCADPKRGDVQVFWTFAGQNCQQAGVNSIQIDIAGELLTPNEYFCIDPKDGSMRVGADLGRFLFGTYDLTLTAFDADGVTRFQASQRFTVQADATVRLDLAPVATADVSWDALNSAGGFALGVNGAMTCDEAQVDLVRIFLDPRPDGSGGTLVGEVPCNSKGVEGAQVAPMPEGVHSFAISAIRNAAFGRTLVYQTTRPAAGNFQQGVVTLIDVDADPVGTGRGSAVLSWDFGAGACPGPITYKLTDPTGVVRVAGASAPCGSTVPISNDLSGLWLVDATAGAMTAHVFFGVPNQSSASWQIPLRVPNQSSSSRQIPFTQ